ncbi:MAG: TetR/AcrR family transcriptional regulator [Cobetia sp.]|jgi:AcrR family transcriptional regulator|uniref:TetR/AcrR family transcriptional regulator n=1 Tax=Cobetia amphilecti TaxID=1055104 RepID=A0AAP4U064_9GAMM|nr:MULTISPECIES: TetR/AcrR family transcriptional regulator [Cobetia]AVV33435.1 TetR/AcrR family transcriptional regulator [Halomonas sp. SF2003]MBR9800159.1 TetR/AcrR family transcriptional regulator [Gammaproteobacteria bacterium]TCJ25216.1 TetR/AcrR family transcriptional regulator [Halomonas sp. GDM18]KGA03075.1 TetR family transcriptional regulator [Cobetia amphilecti]KPM81990.1 TetR family transcriptional regulator [Cobetia sp. UCD-24C]|tara:strand:+ start:8802 stop:9479 length:678 start_codon:yes stop_codon:yes gene_type:complete
MAQTDTVTRILDTAEVLFAERGFAETSLRNITSKAKVNLAAVNYHFGSKKSLIQAVFARYLDPFSERFHAALDSVEQQYAGRQVPLEVLLEVMARTVLEVPAERNSLRTFMRLLGLAYTQGQGHMRRYIREHYGTVFSRFAELLKLATPDLPDNERFWRLHFMLGSVIFTFSGLDALRDIEEAEYGHHTTVRELIQHMRPVVVAAMAAPLPASLGDGEAVTQAAS